MRSAIYLSDMSKCVPKSGLSTKPEKNCWRLIQYEAENITGIMLYAGEEANAPNVTYPLNLEGWHTIYIGIWSGMGYDSEDNPKNLVKVKLKDDSCFTSIAGESGGKAFVIEECFWKHADLTDQHIVFGQQTSGFQKRAAIAYVKLQPLSYNQAEEIQRDRKRIDTKRLIAMNDGFSFFYYFRATTRENIYEQIEPFRNTDFGKLYWGLGAGGEICTYPTKIGCIAGLDKGDNIRLGDYSLVGNRHVAESMQIFLTKGIDPLRTAMDYAHRLGLEFHVSLRMGEFGFFPPFDEMMKGRFYMEHPELRCVDRDGSEITRMSYAFPEFRAYMLAILREVAEKYGVDGVNLIFNRTPPFLMYEKPLVDGFKEKCGEDPREISEWDERWLRYRAEYMTDFIRTVRGVMNDIGRRLRGDRLEVSAVVLADEKVNLYYGLDLKTWLKEELLDTLIPDSWGGVVDIDFFVKLTNGTKCKLYPGGKWSFSPEDYKRKALALYERDVDGLCFWDAIIQAQPFTARWDVLRRLGHAEQLKTRVEEEKQPRLTFVRLKKIGDCNVERYPPHFGWRRKHIWVEPETGVVNRRELYLPSNGE